MTSVGARYPTHARRRGTKKGQLLKILVLVMGTAPALVALGDTSELPASTRALGVLLWFMCTLPGVFYLSRKPAARRPLPFIESISFIYGLYYALPIALGEVNRAWRITVDPRDGYDVPMQLAFLGWIGMMATYGMMSYLLRSRKRSPELPWNPRSITRWASGFLIAGVTVNALRVVIGDNVSVGGVIQLFVSLQWLGVGLLTVLSRRNELSTRGRVILIGGFIAASAVALSQGNVVPIVMLCAVVAFSLWAGRPQIGPGWILAAVVALLIAVSLRGVVREFRMTAWLGTEQFTQVEKLQLMVKLLTDRIANEGVGGTVAWGGSQTAQRSANMDMFADVIRRTPFEVPYWKGQTYYSLIGAAVPRFLWPDKPTKGLGQAFGHRYRYLDPTNLSTAINLPILIEFYVNFGGTAVLIGMLIVGSLYAVLDNILNRPGQSLLVSMIGLTLLLPLLLIESDFSLVFGGLPLSGGALWAIWILMRRGALGGENRRRTAVARATAVAHGQRLGQRPQQPALPSS